MKDYNNKIQADEDQISQEKSTRRNKQLKFNQTITEQLQEDLERSRKERLNEKKPMASGFTPEHELGERYVLHKKKKEQQKILKNLLSS